MATALLGVMLLLLLLGYPMKVPLLVASLVAVFFFVPEAAPRRSSSR